MKKIRVYRRWDNSRFFSPCAAMAVEGSDDIPEKLAGLRHLHSDETLLVQWVEKEADSAGAILIYRVNAQIERVDCL